MKSALDSNQLQLFPKQSHPLNSPLSKALHHALTHNRWSDWNTAIFRVPVIKASGSPPNCYISPPPTSLLAETASCGILRWLCTLPIDERLSIFVQREYLSPELMCSTCAVACPEFACRVPIKIARKPLFPPGLCRTVHRRRQRRNLKVLVYRNVRTSQLFRNEITEKVRIQENIFSRSLPLRTCSCCTFSWGGEERISNRTFVAECVSEKNFKCTN